MGPDLHDITTLQKLIENAEGNDRELHPLYNNLGVAYASVRSFNCALQAHREEKNACRRLLEATPKSAKCYVDLAIAYRQCGDATMHVEKLRHGNGRIITERAPILRIAHSQHYKGLEAVNKACKIEPDFVPAIIEVQAATASVGLTATELGLEMNDNGLLKLACAVTKTAANLAKELPPSVTRKERKRMLHNAANNYALALNGLGYVKMARSMLESTAVFAEKEGDTPNFLRAVANLVDALKVENDLDAAKLYAKMWVERAGQSDDEIEEATACRVLGGILVDRKEYKSARDILQRAMLLSTDKAMRKEAQKSLAIVEQNIADDEEDEKTLAKIEEELPSVVGRHAEEAKKRAEAGNLAFNLRKYALCIKHLERFMALVDAHEHECDPEKIGIHKQKYGRTVANLAESCWKKKRMTDAVRWGTRELLVYGDEKAGQAQAWCNIGNYLADDGKIEEGIEALRRSIRIATECGEDGVLEMAKLNLDIELENLEKKRKGIVDKELPVQNSFEMEDDDDEPAFVPPPRKKTPVIVDSRFNTATTPLSKSAEEVLPRLSAALRNSQLKDIGANTSALTSVPMTGLPQDDRNSVVLYSGDQHLPPRRPVDASCSRGGATSSGVFSVSRPQQVSQKRTRSIMSGPTSSATTTHYRNVADVYKKLCTKDRRGVIAREGILSVLRTAAANCIVEVGTITVNLAEKFISDKELRLVLRALAVFDAGHADGVNLSLARNPLLTDVGLRAFLDDASSRTIVDLDLVGCGIDARGVAHIANACRSGALTGLKRIDLGKNALGRSGAAADACARLLGAGCALEEVVLNMNKLSRVFFSRLVHSAKAERDRAMARGETSDSMVNRIDFSLNNSRNPAGMLEFERPQEAVGCVRTLALVCPRLTDLDLRVCGANMQVRRTLYEFGRTCGKLRVVVVSPGVFDDAAT